jgi:hypothetical protein
MDETQKMLLDNKLLDLKDRLRELPNVKLTSSDYRQLALEEGWDMDAIVFHWLEHHRPAVSSTCDWIAAERARGLVITFKQRAILTEIIRRQARTEAGMRTGPWPIEGERDDAPVTNASAQTYQTNRGKLVFVNPNSVPLDSMSAGGN